MQLYCHGHTTTAMAVRKTWKGAGYHCRAYDIFLLIHDILRTDDSWAVPPCPPIQCPPTTFPLSPCIFPLTIAPPDLPRGRSD